MVTDKKLWNKRPLIRHYDKFTSNSSSREQGGIVRHDAWQHASMQDQYSGCQISKYADIQMIRHWDRDKAYRGTVRTWSKKAPAMGLLAVYGVHTDGP